MLDLSKLTFTAWAAPGRQETAVRAEYLWWAQVAVSDLEMSLGPGPEHERAVTDHLRHLFWREAYGDLVPIVAELRRLLRFETAYAGPRGPAELADTLGALLALQPSREASVIRRIEPRRRPSQREWETFYSDAVSRLVWIVSMLLDGAEASGEGTVGISTDQAADLRELVGRLSPRHGRGGS